jgi:hypothetical protein
MTSSKALSSAARSIAYGSLFLVLAAIAVAAPSAFGQDRKVETIDANAMGTSTQLGKNVSIKVIITRFSTPEERQGFIEAFKKGQNQGLVDALEKAPSVGRIAITGTLGYDLSYISLIKTPTGRKIRFATNRKIAFGEAYRSTQSKEYNLTAGEFNLDDSDKSKSSGVLYPAAQLIINNDGQLQFELRRNPWKLVNIIDWNQAGSKE